jgi:O-antigen/teichoic acid export membrane protein
LSPFFHGVPRFHARAGRRDRALGPQNPSEISSPPECARFVAERCACRNAGKAGCARFLQSGNCRDEIPREQRPDPRFQVRLASVASRDERTAALPHIGEESSTMSVALPLPQESIAKKAVSGALSLALRQALVQSANLLGVVLLARLLAPAEFGVYASVTFAQSFLSRFGDAGLGASLIREPAEPSLADYRTVFSFQQLLVGTVVIAFWLFAPALAHAYRLPSDHAWTLRLVALSFFVSGLRAIPTIRLERALAFDRLALVDTAEALIYNALAVTLAYLGLGSKSFAFALLARAIVGVLLVQRAAPFRMGLTWDLPYVRRHLSFGLSFQAIGLVSLIKDSITPIFVGLWLGAADVGYLNWSQTVAAYAVMALMAFHRLYLPVFARVQQDPAVLGRFVERTLWATNAVTAPLAVTTLALFDPFTTLVFGSKWLVAKPLFLLLSLANLFVPSVTPLLGLFNALGRSRLALGFALLWMATTWLLGAPLVMTYGSIGFAIANAGVQLTNFAVFRTAKRLVPFRLLPTIAPVWLTAACTGLGTSLVERRWPAATPSVLAAYFLGSLAFFVGLLAVLDRKSALAAWSALRGRA